VNQSLYPKPFSTLISIIVFTMSLASVAGAQNFSFPAEGRFILSPSLGAEFLKQCSRLAPARISKFWQPSVSDVEQLELALPAFLIEREKSGKQVPPKKSPYHRQYVGFAENGERFIYGNFFPADMGKEAALNESTRPVVVCDGGPAFWGVVYRVSTKSFEEPHFNGRG
jgi:hypothetical protein